MVGATAEGLAPYFEALLYNQDAEAPAAPAMVPLDPPLIGLELQTILDIQ